MNVEEIKQSIAALTPTEQNEVSAFLFHLRHTVDVDYRESVNARILDRDKTHWLTPEDFERRLEQN